MRETVRIPAREDALIHVTGVVQVVVQAHAASIVQDHVKTAA